MRILTVRQPWAWAIVHGGKDVENRVRNIAGDYRGPVAIHAGLAVFEEEGGAYPEVARAIESEIQGYRVDDDYLWEVADDVDPEDPRFVYGAILGVVDLVDVHRSGPFPGECWREPAATASVDRCSAWAEDDAHHLVLSNPRALDEPLLWKGGLGLRRLPLSVHGDALIGPVDGCTCGAGRISYQHEPMCGFELVARLKVSA